MSVAAEKFTKCHDHVTVRMLARADDQRPPAVARLQTIRVLTHQPLDVTRPLQADRGGQLKRRATIDEELSSSPKICAMFW